MLSLGVGQGRHAAGKETISEEFGSTSSSSVWGEECNSFERAIIQMLKSFRS